MKRVLGFVATITMMSFALFACAFFVPENETSAASFASETVTLEQLSVTMSATSRSGTDLEYEIASGTNLTGEEVKYTVFKWSQLQSLKFSFDVGAAGETSYTYSLGVDYVKAESILPSIANHDQSSSLKSGTALISKDQSFVFTFYIDSDATANGTNVAKGYDFGLYRFRVSYSYTDQDTLSTVSKVDYFYVAVFPDSISDIEIPDGLGLSYSISSGNSLLNAYTLSLDTSIFDYCNPAYLVWRVEGYDELLNQYCYNLTMQQMEEFSSFDVIWNSESTATGTSFFFDSNGIEGLWTVSLYVMDEDGGILAAYNVDLSTVKEGSSSLLWIVLVIILAVLVVGGIVLFVLYYSRKRKEGVW